jgi:hypothetical protein
MLDLVISVLYELIAISAAAFGIRWLIGALRNPVESNVCFRYRIYWIAKALFAGMLVIVGVFFAVLYLPAAFTLSYL